jgi:hypothetical protein
MKETKINKIHQKFIVEIVREQFLATYILKLKFQYFGKTWKNVEHISLHIFVNLKNLQLKIPCTTFFSLP